MNAQQQLHEKQQKRRAERKALSEQVKGEAVKLDQGLYQTPGPTADVKLLRQTVYLLQQRTRTLENMMKQLFENDVDTMLDLFVDFKDRLNLCMDNQAELGEYFQKSMKRLDNILNMLNIHETRKPAPEVVSKVERRDTPEQEFGEVYDGDVPEDQELPSEPEQAPVLRKKRET